MALEDDAVRVMEIHGDVLEFVFSRVPLLDLVSASHVSKAWRDAVFSSLRLRNRPPPWLILHTQAARPPYAIAARAYDPREVVWIDIPRPPIEHVSDLRSSGASFLYMLSPSRFSFSFDALNLYWHHAEAPQVWRRDPVVARVGSSVVVAGGGCDFEDNPLAVEIYDLRTRAWRSSDSIPGRLRSSSASPWLSVAATAEKLIITEKESGLTLSFDPDTSAWSDRIYLNPSRSVCAYHIGYTDFALILVGLCGIENFETVWIWKMREDDFWCEEIGEMPAEYVEKLRSESEGNLSVEIRTAGNTVFIYNTDSWDVAEVVACELMVGGGGFVIVVILGEAACGSGAGLKDLRERERRRLSISEGRPAVSLVAKGVGPIVEDCVDGVVCHGVVEWR